MVFKITETLRTIYWHRSGLNQYFFRVLETLELAQEEPGVIYSLVRPTSIIPSRLTWVKPKVLFNSPIAFTTTYYIGPELKEHYACFPELQFGPEQSLALIYKVKINKFLTSTF